MLRRIAVFVLCVQVFSDGWLICRDCDCEFGVCVLFCGCGCTVCVSGLLLSGWFWIRLNFNARLLRVCVY